MAYKHLKMEHRSSPVLQSLKQIQPRYYLLLVKNYFLDITKEPLISGTDQDYIISK